MEQGRERVEAELLGRGQVIIVEELTKIPAFKQSMHELANKYPDMALVKDFEYPLDIMIANGTLKQDDTKMINRMEGYIASLRELADSYNLRCSWIIAGLHHMLRNLIDSSIRTEISNYYLSYIIDRLRLDTPIHSDTRKEDIQHLFDEEWERIKSRHPELQLRARIPGNFNLYVWWLCQRLFFGKTGKTMDIGHPDNPDKDWTVNYIDFKIRRTAQCLGIKLRIGRPPKVKRR